MNYYNENDSFAAKWLRELIKEKLIPDGEVDERSIADVKPKDLDGFIKRKNSGQRCRSSFSPSPLPATELSL